MTLSSNNVVIKVLATQVGITGSSQDLKDTIIDQEERNIESTTTEVIDDVQDSDLDLLSRPYVMGVAIGSTKYIYLDTKGGVWMCSPY
jgi:hypothetical protein